MRKLLILFLLAGAIRAGARDGAYVEGEVLVRFRHGVPEASARRITANRGLGVKRNHRVLSEFLGQPVMLVRSSTKTTAELVDELSRDPNVEDVTPNYLKRVSASRMPTDPLFWELWGLNNTGQVVGGVACTPDADVDLPEALNLSRMTNTEVIVAVIDTGADYTHPDLAAVMWRNPLENPTNGIDDDSNGYVDDYYGYDFAGDNGGPPDSDPQDVDSEFGHGTHVSGTIAAAMNNAIGIAGFHPNIRIMALKASPDGLTLDDSATIAATEYAAMMKTGGCNIASINASYGGPSFNPDESTAILAAGSAGIIFCAAAGNSGLNIDLVGNREYPASYSRFNIIAVAASDPADHLATFSNYGTNDVDLMAPGTNTLSSLPASFYTDALVEQGATIYTGQGMSFAGTTTGITATLHGCGLGYATSFPAGVVGNIALIERGDLFFSEKISNAMVAGAVAAVIYNTNSSSFLGTLQNPGDWIPAISITGTDGQALLALGTSIVTVVNRPNPTNAFQFGYGTSMATPHVAGAAALIALNYPNETMTQRVLRILNNVDPIPGMTNYLKKGGRLNVARAIDTDRDGLPDWWERTFTTNLTNMSATNDLDDDGASNIDEYWTDTDASNALSFFRADVSSGDGAGVFVRWDSATGRTYRIQSSAGVSNAYSTIASNIPAVPPVNTYTDAAAGAENARFYRVELE